MDNSRLKFRVWYNGDYSLTPFCNLDRNGNVWLFYSENDEDMESWDGIDITDKCTLEMSTGLMDKNGNLIYEGDIVDVTFFDGELGDNGGFVEKETHETGKVAWQEQCGMFVVLIDEHHFRPFMHISDPTEDIEIIGNAHTEEQK